MEIILQPLALLFNLAIFLAGIYKKRKKIKIRVHHIKLDLDKNRSV